MTGFKLGYWILAASLLIVGAARADEFLIREVENLRNSLPAKDPTRQTLTLRLADVLFDEAGEISKAAEPGTPQEKQLNQYRKRAMSLYQESLNGGHGLYAPVTGNLKYRVQFQLARLYTDLGLIADAKPLWKVLMGQTELLPVQREAAFRLAEFAENEKSASEAEALFRQAVALCGQTDLCSYGKYRRAWALRNMGKLDAAIEEMQQALVDSRGQVREEALRDLIAMMGARTGDGQDSLVLADQLSAKFSRPRLVFDLADAYYSAGNRAAGTLALEFADQRQPELRNRIRLLEENYGLRRWERFHALIDQTLTTAAGQSLDPSKEVEAEKILRRLTVQLDGERISDSKRAEEFKSLVSIYLSLFPSSKEKMKMIEGWLAAEKDPSLKLKQTQGWLADARLALSGDEQTRLHDARVALAREAKDHALVASEAAMLENLTGDAAKKRDYRYGRARALYEMKDYVQALPLFVELAQVRGKPQKWAVESEQLAIDILGQQKNYQAVLAQAATWLSSADLQAVVAKDSALKKEMTDLAAISENAEFELGVALGQNPEALRIFTKFCQAKKVLPKSCENAKILAVKLKDQKTLIAILREQGRKSDLAAEYERGAYFAEAAKLLEAELDAKSDLRDFLKIGLLYEVADHMGDRDRVLKSMASSLRSRKSLSADEEAAIYASFKEAGLLDSGLVSLAWSNGYRTRLADYLESNGKGNAETRKVLAASPESTGPAWNKMVVTEVRKLDEAQRKIGFYGKRGEAKFQTRLAALKKLVTYSEKILQGADAATRVEIAQLLADSNAGLAKEILDSPLPPQLSEEEAKPVREAIAKLAQPFQERAKLFAATAEEQKAKVIPVAATQAPAPQKLADTTVIRGAIEALHADPMARAALLEIKNFFETNGKQRIASYFQGRLAQVEEEGKGGK